LLAESLPAVTTIGAVARSPSAAHDPEPQARCIPLDIELGDRTGFDLLTELDGQ
jgi:hypothetical protein